MHIGLEYGKSFVSALLNNEKAFTFYNDILADSFIAVVDDWNWEQVRQGTFEAFDQLGYQILYENYFSAEYLGNGVYCAVIRKK